MADYLLDTNHLSPLVSPGHVLRQRILERLEAGDRFAIAAPVLAEMLFGIQLLPRATQNLAEWAVLRDGFDYYDVTRRDAEQAAELQVSLRRRGWQMETVDALIAAIGLRHRLTLLTTDGDFRALDRLPQQNWLATL